MRQILRMVRRNVEIKMRGLLDNYFLKVIQKIEINKFVVIKK
jgi:hypothetical protein